MKHKIYIFLFLLVLMLSFGSFERVLACSCVRNVPCQSYQNADMIFVGKVVEKKRIKGNYFTHKFEIIESFKGVNKKKQIQVRANEQESICGYNFKSGETYLVYASKSKSGKFSTGLCSRTKPVERAQEDFNFLQNLSKNSEGKIYGQVFEKLIFRKGDEIKPFANMPLKVIETGNERNAYETITDIKGTYEFNVPAGSYEIIPVIPGYAHIPDDQNFETEINLQANGCANINFFVANKGQIIGKMISSDGEIISGVTVELIDSETGEWVTDVESQSDGSFKFEKVPAGKYVLAINKNLSPHAESPFPTTYFPQTSDIKKAKIVEIGFGQNMDQILFQVLPKLMDKEIRGTVYWNDGKPAADVQVELVDLDNYDSWQRDEKNGKTDKFGNFAVKGFIGRKYQIKAIYKRVSTSTEIG